MIIIIIHVIVIAPPSLTYTYWLSDLHYILRWNRNPNTFIGWDSYLLSLQFENIDM